MSRTGNSPSRVGTFAPESGASRDAVNAFAGKNSPHDQFGRLAGELGRVLDRFEVKPRTQRESIKPGRESNPERISRVKSAIQARAKRAQHFPVELFADPAWSILLELYLADLEQRRTTISCLCVGAEVPGTTALRWITALVERGLIVRHPDRLDRRRVYVELSSDSLQAMTDYFEQNYPI